MSIRNDLKILYHLVLRPVRGKDHAQRMESFYSGQAEGYDDFRKRLLQGREHVYETLGQSEPAVWVDFGGGTGANLEFIGPNISKISKVYVVDLATSLLGIVNKRSERHGWKNVEAVTGDATTWTPPEGSADVVTFSYSLTMIPDWFAAIDNAIRILKPGGRLGVVDFMSRGSLQPKDLSDTVGPLVRFGQHGLRRTTYFQVRTIFLTCKIGWRRPCSMSIERKSRTCHCSEHRIISS